MQRGEVWWVQFEERRPVVLLSGDAASGFQALQIVPPSGVDLDGVGIEVPIGPAEGLAYEGVIRLAFPHPDFLFCTWLTTLDASSLEELACVLPAGKLDEVDEAVRLAARPHQPTAAATDRLNEMRDALRRGSLRAAPEPELGRWGPL